ncbi:hypothetical protein OY671_010788, partial [Metschnikowia pulcherrima]
MRTHGIPFANRYRTKNGSWNPIRHGSTQRSTSTDRIISFSKASPKGKGEMWNAADVRAFAEILTQKDILKRGSKTASASITDEAPINPRQLYEWFEEDIADQLIQASIDSDPSFLHAHALPSKRGASEYPVQVLKRGGSEALTAAPRITIGTIHSVKGGQADRVYV